MSVLGSHVPCYKIIIIIIFFGRNSTNTSGIASAVLAAKNADVALLVLGLESGDLNNQKIEGEV